MKRFLKLGIVIFLILSGCSAQEESQIKLQKAPDQNKKEEALVVLGGSFAKANNLSSSMVKDSESYSFATGDKINSVYTYLKSKNNNLVSFNLAESGASTNDLLEKQLPKAEGLNAKYFIIGIASDVFSSNSAERFKKNLEEIAMEVKSEDSIVMIGNYPNIVKLRGASYPSCREDKLHLGLDEITDQKIEMFNKAIEEVAKEYNLILVDIYNILDSQDVSDYDCLHPNIEGQKKLAKEWIKILELK